MNATHRIATALAVLAVVLIGCSQITGGPTSGTAPAATGAPTTSPAPEPSEAATAAAAPQPPTQFTGTIRCGPPVSPDRQGAEEILDVGDEGMVLSRSRGGAWEQSVTMSDPRLEGAVYHTFEADEYHAAGAEEGAGVWAATRRIVNTDGAWENTGHGGSFPDGTPIGENSTEVYIGEGAYEGLVAVMEVANQVEGGCDVVVRGVIFEGAPVPEPYHPD